jgi:hypothetical protein
MTQSSHFSNRCTAANLLVVIAFFYAIACSAVDFPLPTINATFGVSQAVVVGDFRGNGKADIVTADGDPSTNITTLTLWENDGRGDFFPGATVGTPTLPGSFANTTVLGATCGNVCVVDLNGDGKDDVIVAGNVVTVVINTVTESTTPLYFLWSNGKGDFIRGGGLNPKGCALSYTYSPSILATELNRDYHPDLLLSGSAFSEPIFATALGPTSNPVQEGVPRVIIQPPGAGTVTAGYAGVGFLFGFVPTPCVRAISQSLRGVSELAQGFVPAPVA